ncbi:LamG-like jellyroll fold domain-containing protein [Gordonia amicalis]|uniref:LamG-like jellyroll fold domain-containing protein n=1 Tax=Gordonia amicalis TaxID=89053 RepID=UPI0024BB94B9|nr:LamG-like jellyroll fold domain-containing protein [Gordonia amicalis]MDJ0454431.1 cellulase family glycosylhydrolase [Gordonia amicalis]MDV7077680.1 LamG-like jellyroll fold domain-containing protein [Gordonia amicalis]
MSASTNVQGSVVLPEGPWEVYGIAKTPMPFDVTTSANLKDLIVHNLPGNAPVTTLSQAVAAWMDANVNTEVTDTLMSELLADEGSDARAAVDARVAAGTAGLLSEAVAENTYAPQSVVAAVAAKATPADVAAARNAAQAYTDKKLGAGFNPAVVPNLQAWFDAANLTVGAYGFDTFGRANSSTLGTSASGLAWTNNVNNIGIVSGRAMMPSGTSDAIATLASTRASDYAVDAAVKLGPSSASFSMYVRYTASNNHIKLVARHTGASNFLQLVATVDGVETSLWTGSSAGLVLDTTHQLHVEVLGNTYRVYLDRTLKTTTTDSGSNFPTSTVTGFGFNNSDNASACVGFFVAPISLYALPDSTPISGWPEIAKATSLQAGAQATAAAKPTLKLGIQSNQAVLRFDGTDDTMPTRVPANPAEVTIVAVVQHAEAQTGTIIGSGGTGGLQWRINASGTMELLKANTASIGQSALSVPVGAVAVVAVVYDSTGTYSFYLNGKPAGGGVNAQTFTASTFLTIGATAGSEFFNGDIGELVVFTRGLTGPELRSIMGGLASKRGVVMPQRILSETPAPLVVNGYVKGSNIHPKAADLSTYANAWRGLWGNWDWTWIKRSVDRAKAQGANTIRLIGDVQTVADGVISQATYLSQLEQWVDYCASEDLKVYACLGDPTHYSSATPAYIADWYATQAELLVEKDNLLAMELMNEVGNGAKFFPESMLAAMVAQFSAAVRAVAPNIPLSVSDPSHGNATVVGKFTDGARLLTYAPYVDFFDIHVYPKTSLTFRPWHTAAYELVSDRPLIFGEVGAYRPGNTAVTMAAQYEEARQAMLATPSVKGAIQWAAVNNDFGLYDETTDTLQTDIASAWAAFPAG